MKVQISRPRRWATLIQSFLAAVCLIAGTASLVHGQTPAAPDASPPPTAADYRLGVADKVRILVYNEPNLTGEYLVNANGAIAFPLIGDVQAQGHTATEVKDMITTQLSNGYLRDPQVSIDILSYRPFYILGEVNKPGEYPYEEGISVLKAVAAASGFTYRADEHHVYVKRAGQTTETRYDISGDLLLQPGDTVRIAQRWF
jgi:polysaccharide export outer membrane protein